MRRILLTVGLITFAFYANASAQEVGFPARTVGDLAKICDSTQTGSQRAAALNFCHGYAQGLMSIVLRQTGDKPFCLPEHPPSRTATMNDFVTWARAKETRLALPASSGMEDFFKERFPCPTHP